MEAVGLAPGPPDFPHPAPSAVSTLTPQGGHWAPPFNSGPSARPNSFPGAGVLLSTGLPADLGATSLAQVDSGTPRHTEQQPQNGQVSARYQATQLCD